MKPVTIKTIDKNLEESRLIKFFPKIDVLEEKKSLQESTRYPFTEQDLVYSILHRFSNYDNVVWSLYASNDSQFILSQLKQALIKISYIDSSLTWACMEIMERYKSQLKIRQKKSSYIINPSLNLN